ncbi:hypothetical protein FACS189444_1700 [Spirochaetia bacterium]|nr:hypothetical protein FACS189444_1700 [Spirochaetia bacterium]
MGHMIYRGAVAFKEWGERVRFGLAVSLGKFTVDVVSRIVRVGKPKAPANGRG